MKEFDRNFFSGTYSNKKYVDLGLNVHWATSNVGAKNPEEFGEYYPWGVLTSFELLKMQSYDPRIISNLLSARPSPILKDISGTRYDIAKIYYGEESAWRTPRWEDFQELFMNTRTDVISIGEIIGYQFTSIINGNSIFLPAAGHFSQFAQNYIDEVIEYWTSERYDGDDEPQTPQRGFGISFYSDDPHVISPAKVNVNTAMPIRPVLDSRILQNR